MKPPYRRKKKNNDPFLDRPEILESRRIFHLRASLWPFYYSSLSSKARAAHPHFLSMKDVTMEWQISRPHREDSGILDFRFPPSPGVYLRHRIASRVQELGWLVP